MKPDKASEQDNYSEKDENALNENNDLSKSAPGVDVPEAFQKQVHAMTSKATKPMISHMRMKMGEREDAMRDEEMASKGKGGKMTMDEAPVSIGD